MAKILTIEGKSNTDELLRLDALEKISDLDTNELVRLAELKEHPKARTFLKTSLAFSMLKGFLNTK